MYGLFVISSELLIWQAVLGNIVQFVDRPVPKTIDIFDCKMDAQGANFTQTFFSKQSVLYIKLFAKSNQTLRGLMHLQFTRSTLGTLGTLIPPLATKRKRLAFFDLGFHVRKPG